MRSYNLAAIEEMRHAERAVITPWFHPNTSGTEYMLAYYAWVNGIEERIRTYMAGGIGSHEVVAKADLIVPSYRSMRPYEIDDALKKRRGY